MRYVIAAAVVMLATALPAQAQEAASPPAELPTLEDIAWLAGSWRGEGLGGTYEEIWSSESAGTMMCMFRLVVDSKIRVIEYVMVTEQEDRVVLRFKHFNDDYSTWEEDQPLEFTLISASGREAVFHSEVPAQNAPRRITYRLTDAGELLATVAGSDEEGRLSDGFELRFARRDGEGG